MPQLPNDIVFRVAGGQMTLTFEAPTYAGHAGVNIYRNNTKVKSLYTDTTWYDPTWTENHVYQLGSEDDGGNEERTEVLIFPYYPNAYPEVQYYRDAWLLAAERLGQGLLGRKSHRRVLKHKIRHELELERIDNGLLTDVVYTEAGPLTDSHYRYERMPLVHIAGDVTPQLWDTSKELEYSHQFVLSVLGDGRDVFARMGQVEDLCESLAWICARQFSWDGMVGAYDTPSVQIAWPSEATVVERGEVRVLVGEVRLTVMATRAWRDEE